MRILIIKTSSLGDVIHTLPALTDASLANPECQFDWVVEESFSEIPHWHPAVNRVIPVALRRWRKNWRLAIKSGQVMDFIKQLRQQHYDAIIDAQGLFKSVLLSLCARGSRHGFDRYAIRGKNISWLYQQHYSVQKKPTRAHAHSTIIRANTGL